jgi:hypothetical protein
MTTRRRKLRFGAQIARFQNELLEKLIRLTDAEIALLTPFLLTHNIGIPSPVKKVNDKYFLK